MKPGKKIFDSLEDFQNSNRVYEFHCSTSVATSQKSKDAEELEAGEAPKHIA